MKKSISIYLILLTFFSYAQNVKRVKVANGNHDVEVTSTNGVNFTSSDLDLHGFNNNLQQESFFRFENVSLPAGAVINSVKILFNAFENSTTNSVLNISGELASSVAYPTSTATSTGANLKARNYASTGVQWQTTGAVVNQPYFSPELVSLVNQMAPNGLNNFNLSFRVRGNQQGRFNVFSFNGNPDLAPTLVIEYTSFSSSETYRITNANDDAEEEGPSKNTVLTGTNLEIGGINNNTLNSANNKQLTGFRFPNVVIPANAQITNAFIEFFVSTTSNNSSANCIIRAEKTNALPYTNTAANISNRNYSALAINWIPQRFATVSQSIKTPNLKNIIDESRLDGWESGDALSFMIDGDKFIGAVRSRNNSETLQPRLVIEYQNNGNGPSLEGVIQDVTQINLLYINEVSSQGTALQEEDWIELYNDNTLPVYIKDKVFISDKADDLERFELKNIIIPAKGRTILIADELTELGKNHLNFKVSQTPGTLFLSKKVNNAISSLDQLAYVTLTFNQTYGRTSDGNQNLVIFQKETYNLPNQNGTRLVNIGVSQDRGVYPSGFPVTLTVPAGHTVRYTLDGKNPTATFGTVYSAPINITKTSVLKILATAANSTSGIQQYSYILKNNFPNEVAYGDTNTNLLVYHWNNKSKTTAQEYADHIGKLPVISFTTDSEPTPDDVSTYVEYIDKHLNSSNNNYFSPAAVKRFGQASIDNPNPNIKLTFKREFLTKKAEYPFFELYPNDQFPVLNVISKLELKEGQDGPSTEIIGGANGFNRYSEKICQNLYKQMGKYGLSTKFVHLFINGKYRGIKTMREDFDPNNLEEYFGDDDDNYTQINCQDSNWSDGLIEEGDGLTSLWTQVKSLANAKNFQAFKELVDVDDLIKFQIHFMYVDTENEANGIIHNQAPLYSKLKFNINDTDGAFFKRDRGDSGGGPYDAKWDITSSRQGPGKLFGNFMGSNTDATVGNLEFKTLVKDQVLKQIGPAVAPWQGTPSAPLSLNNVTNMLINVVNEIDLLHKVDAAYMSYLPNIDVYNRWKNTEQPRILLEVPGRVELSLKKWLEYNMAHTLNQVEIVSESAITSLDPITFNNLNVSGTTIYYTVNGTDPMGPDGMISSQAVLYQGPINLNEGLYTIVTRAFAPNNWGPLSYKAITVSDNSLEKQLMHFWLFDNTIANDLPLTTIQTKFSVPAAANISYQSCLVGYPFVSTDPNWRKSSMERRNAPTPINYFPEANNNVPYSTSIMRGIQIKEAFQNGTNENILNFNVPTTDFRKISFSFAAINQSSGVQNLLVDYFDTTTSTWILKETFNLTNNFELFKCSFNDVALANNNANFQIRIRFGGTNLTADAGNRVTFNNFAIQGLPNNPTIASRFSNSSNVQDLNNEGTEVKVYPNPTSDYLNIAFEGNHTINALEVMDMTGKTHILLNNIVSNNAILVSYLPAGVYILNATLSNGLNKTIKFVKK